MKKISDSNDELDIIISESGDKLDNEYDISKLLTKYQQRILDRSKLPEHFSFSNDDLDEIDNENTQLDSELDFENFF